MLPDKTEHRSNVAYKEDGGSDYSNQGKDSRHETRLVEQESQQQVAYGWHKTLSQEEDAIIQGDKHMAGDQCLYSTPRLPQGHD
ncbi:hypothetical protein KDA_53520 [Dictyobacter alpinus]|uniref:Uncharacterized protein n=1 Tax=Dictyobacter alpinus TaxID=2014873 RepID=A0A402BEP7_9CHLR|nr:hypothetical protein KDA_53520 [Dictyobacter alpinus]